MMQFKQIKKKNHMIIIVVAEKAYDKIKKLIHDETSQKTNFLNLIKKHLQLATYLIAKD